MKVNDCFVYKQLETDTGKAMRFERGRQATKVGR